MSRYKTLWGRVAQRFFTEDQLMQFEERLAMMDENLSDYEIERAAYGSVAVNTKSDYLDCSEMHKYNITFKRLRLLGINWGKFIGQKEMQFIIFQLYKEKITEKYFEKDLELLNEEDIKFCESKEGMKMVLKLEIQHKTEVMNTLKNTDIDGFIKLKKEIIKLQKKKI